ncbi:MAG TPA: sulfatase-like hydrolase/transferase [Thermoanaerobaculia bacterium]|nr:sulfatase-like hydrolase/transferase [Thermoanaerobaculia bacterium]
MKRSPVLLAALLLAALAGAGVWWLLGRRAGGTGSRGADVVLVTLDTLRHDALGFAGNARVETPVLDALAASGRVFPETHAHNVVTLPSHTNILTGLYPHQHGVRDNSGFTLSARFPTLATLLQGAGYATAAFVGAFPLDARFGLGRGFEVYDDRYPEESAPTAFVIAERPGDQVVAPALAWWRANAGKKRFLWVHLYDPHAPYAPPEPFASRYAAEPYLGEVAATDAFLAPLLRPFLDGAESPALVAVTADHGEALGDHGELTHGLFAYEATLKVPLVLWGAGVEPGVDRRPAGHVDLLPTLLAAVGVEAPADLPGSSLLAPPAAGERRLYFEALSPYLNRGWAPLRGVLGGKEKLIELPLPELYDLAADPAERDNRFDRERRTFRALRAALPREAVWPPRPGTISADAAARLRSLGYVAGSPGGRTRFTAEDDPKRLVELDRTIHEVIDRYSRGDLAAAAALARQGVAARPEMSAGYEHLALVLRQQERVGEAVAVLQDGLRRGATSPSLLRELGLALAEAGRADEAVAVLQPAAAAGDDVEAMNALAAAYYTAGRLAEAEGAAERVLARDPGNVKALETLGAAALAAGRPRQAAEHLERALAENPALPIAWNSLGVASFQLGEVAAALTAWERSLALDPRQFDALYNYGVIAAEAGQRVKARAALERFVATAPPERFAADIAAARRLLSGLAG